MSTIVAPLIVIIPLIIFVAIGLIGARIYGVKNRNLLSGFLVSLSLTVVLLVVDFFVTEPFISDAALKVFSYVGISGTIILLAFLWAFVPSRKTKDGVKPTYKQGNKIFISYRRDDTAHVAGRIYDRLIQKFGRNRIFKDVDSIPVGVNFKEYLTSFMDQCGIMIVVIGDKWLDIADSTNYRRLDNREDFVRIEVEAALQRDLVIIPVLVNDITMPSINDLPDTLKPLAHRNGIVVRRDPDFHRDVDRLIKALRSN